MFNLLVFNYLQLKNSYILNVDLLTNERVFTDNDATFVSS